MSIKYNSRLKKPLENDPRNDSAVPRVRLCPVEERSHKSKIGCADQFDAAL